MALRGFRHEVKESFRWSFRASIQALTCLIVLLDPSGKFLAPNIGLALLWDNRAKRLDSLAHPKVSLAAFNPAPIFKQNNAQD